MKYSQYTIRNLKNRYFLKIKTIMKKEKIYIGKANMNNQKDNNLYNDNNNFLLLSFNYLII